MPRAHTLSEKWGILPIRDVPAIGSAARHAHRALLLWTGLGLMREPGSFLGSLHSEPCERPERQREYARGAWNFRGDIFREDDRGVFPSISVAPMI